MRETKRTMLAADLEQAIEDLEDAAKEIFMAEDFVNDAVERRESLFGALSKMNAAKLVIQATCRELAVAEEGGEVESQRSSSRSRLRAAGVAS